MEFYLAIRPDCPSSHELQQNVAAAMRDIGISSDLPVSQLAGSASCPQLIINGMSVCSCFPKKAGSPCPLCGVVPDIPDAEVIRWNIARALGRKTVLFICSGNAVRSQMAEAIINHTLGHTWAAFSGGIMPMQLWKPVIQVLQEIGIDANDRKAKHIEIFLGCRFDLIISLCSDADAFCTSFPGEGVREHLPFNDPMTSSFFGVGDVTRTRKLRDDMKNRLCAYLGGLP